MSRSLRDRVALVALAALVLRRDFAESLPAARPSGAWVPLLGASRFVQRLSFPHVLVQRDLACRDVAASRGARPAGTPSEAGIHTATYVMSGFAGIGTE